MSELVTDYLERAVSLGKRLDMWWHLYRCQACRRYYDQVRRTVGLFGSGAARPTESQTEETLVAAAREERRHDS